MEQMHQNSAHYERFAYKHRWRLTLRLTPDSGLSTFTVDNECQVIYDFRLVVAIREWMPVDKILGEMTYVPLLHDVIDIFDN